MDIKFYEEQLACAQKYGRYEVRPKSPLDIIPDAHLSKLKQLAEVYDLGWEID